ncbi:MAG TPA: rhomboid family intramembrane serine protease [Gemmatales bacterium]|nr:rhomboid family intramembrane serine protease [Gemmatales bacterium]
MLPIGSNDYDLRQRPFVTYGLIFINVIVFVLLQRFGTNDAFTYSYSLVPYEFLSGHDLVTRGDEVIDVTRDELLGTIPPHSLHLGPTPQPVYITLLTSLFMHGSFMHLLGNMLFLWIFGKHLEDALGMFRFLAFYLVAGICASLVHILFNQSFPGSIIPTLGASGAISGVLAGYVMLFPHKMIGVIIFFFAVELPAWVFIGIWFGFQVINGLGTFGDQVSGIAYSAHIGGFLVGLALIVPFSTGREFEEHSWRYH